jgi:hypothetical protein
MFLQLLEPLQLLAGQAGAGAGQAAGAGQQAPVPWVAQPATNKAAAVVTTPITRPVIFIILIYPLDKIDGNIILLLSPSLLNSKTCMRQRLTINTYIRKNCKSLDAKKAIFLHICKEVGQKQNNYHKSTIKYVFNYGLKHPK